VIALIYFPLPHVYFFVGGGTKSIAKLDGRVMAGFFALDPPLVDHHSRG